MILCFCDSKRKADCLLVLIERSHWSRCSVKYFICGLLQLFVGRIGCNVSYIKCSCKRLLQKLLKTRLMLKGFVWVGAAGWVHPPSPEPAVAPSAAQCSHGSQPAPCWCCTGWSAHTLLGKSQELLNFCRTGAANAFSPVLKPIQGSLHHQRTDGAWFCPSDNLSS